MIIFRGVSHHRLAQSRHLKSGMGKSETKGETLKAYQTYLVVSTHLTNISQIVPFPQVEGENKKNIWNHHLETIASKIPGLPNFLNIYRGFQTGKFPWEIPHKTRHFQMEMRKEAQHLSAEPSNVRPSGFPGCCCDISQQISRAGPTAAQMTPSKYKR